MQSINKFAESFQKEETKLHILVNNAGIMSQTKKLNDKGAELTFAVNVLGHRLLSRYLLSH